MGAVRGLAYSIPLIFTLKIFILFYNTFKKEKKKKINLFFLFPFYLIGTTHTGTDSELHNVDKLPFEEARRRSPGREPSDRPVQWRGPSAPDRDHLGLRSDRHEHAAQDSGRSSPKRGADPQVHARQRDQDASDNGQGDHRGKPQVDHEARPGACGSLQADQCAALCVAQGCNGRSDNHGG